MRIALSTLVLVLLLAPAVRAEEDTLVPSPHDTPAAALRDVEGRGHARSAEAEAPVDADVVGAVTPRGSHLGFMPLLQHHMAVEHWFLEGPAAKEFARQLQGGERRFVRLRGKLTLLGVFGGSALDWYGDGLQHGRDWGPVMGYHERVYRFAVDEVVWVRTRAEQVAAQQRIQSLQRDLQADMERLDWAAARKKLPAVLEGMQDAGLDPRGLDKVDEYLRRMLVLERDPATWSEDERRLVAETLVGVPVTPYKELKKGARAKLEALLASWPEAVRQGLGPRVVEAWTALEYRFQRNKARSRLVALDAPATRAMLARLEEATSRVEAAKARLDTLRDAGDYAGLLAVLEELAPDQALVLDYALVENQTKHWVPAARRLAALHAVMDDRATREALLAAQVRETVAEGTGLPNQHLRPRYNAEIVARFVPRLTVAERRRIETLLLEMAQPLRASEDWKQVLLVAELLSGFGEQRARDWFREQLRRSARQPPWQREHLERFAASVGASR